MVFKHNGTIGINEPNPAFPFQVRIDAGNEGHMLAAGGWGRSSDRRFKKNIAGIEDALEKIMQVKGIRFDYLTDKSTGPKKGERLGFIAQDLETVLPELVETDASGYKRVLLDDITPVLVEAVKDNQKDIDSLRKEIEALKTRK
jgi:hypothetical protein